MSAGAVAAAAARRAERELVKHLREAGASSTSTAVAIPDPRWMERRVLKRLAASGAIREANGGYFLDEALYSAYRSRRWKRVAIALASVGFVSALVILWASTR